jgi:methylated-DNA-[protein]-cysteine S-methyltransferase
MMVESFALFDTAIGRCGIAWSTGGIGGVQLPEADDARTRARIRRRHPGAVETPPPREVLAVCEAIAALARGERRDLTDVALDMQGVPAFDRQVYELARGIAPGTTSTYGAIASRLGKPEAARDVGRALGENRFAIVVPCHRVLAAGGKVGGFSAHGGIATKRRLLAIESALAPKNLDEPMLFDWPVG